MRLSLTWFVGIAEFHISLIVSAVIGDYDICRVGNQLKRWSHAITGNMKYAAKIHVSVTLKTDMTNSLIHPIRQSESDSQFVFCIDKSLHVP